ncbi:FadR/GntR family transcriptional regulator [Paracoccus sp. (in: a-proteobacteria)]|uniref:FadR/GntR family transcriptional regulator n=1 Tax=Paracoccus sp. TaxID=267 RepID=UPI00289E0893|nr:FadR/GntR family transcriptional regulator [Paracoccus sp. (in: a-proteobacteria)]
MSLKLDKVDRGPHLSTLVASSITREIAQGRLKAGDQLPTELQLSKTFGVSRNVIREAIARLRSEGRVWTRQGRGAFVSDEADTSVLTVDLNMAAEGEAYRSLFELRGILEVEGAGLAAQRATPQDLEAMKLAVAAMRAAPYGSVAWLQGDLEFHQAIARATGNDLIVQFLTVVAEKVRESILASGHQRASEELATNTLAEHNAILDAIGIGAAPAARRAMAGHLRLAATRLGLDGLGLDGKEE